jgi:hypothetical protein
MFKALKGKAAAALDAASTVNNTGGGNTKELEAKVVSMVRSETLVLLETLEGLPLSSLIFLCHFFSFSPNSTFPGQGTEKED